MIGPAEPAARGAVQRLHAGRVPRYRLFLFHHAGGSPATWRSWQHLFPADWEVCTVGLPGRGRLHDRPPLADCQDAVRFLLPELLDRIDLPYGFFGHSMGGLLAYELTRSLTDRGLAAPSWLGISACTPPPLQVCDREPRREPLSESQLRQWLTDYGDAPEQLLADPATWKLFRPMFRADFALVDSWWPDVEASPLPVPMTVFGGTEDPVVDPAQLARWGRYTQRFLGVQHYPGGHRYLEAHRREVARKVVLSVLFAHNGVKRAESRAAS